MTKEQYKQWAEVAAEQLPQTVEAITAFAKEVKEHDKEAADLMLQYAATLGKLATHLQG